MVSITRLAVAALALTAPVAARRRRRHHHPCSATSVTKTTVASSTELAGATYVAPSTATSVTISSSHTTVSKTNGAKAKPTKVKSYTTFQTSFTTAYSTPPKAHTTTALLGGPYANTPTANAASPSSTIVTDVAAVFKPGVVWDICLDNPIKHDSVNIIPQEAKVWDIDLGHAHDNPTLIPVLKEAGKFIICYFNAGAVQSWDTDASQFSSSVIGNSLGGPYSSEHYLDIRSQTVLSIMKKRLDKAVALGCDAVDPDNTDAWVQNGRDPTGFALTASDYVTYLQNLAAYAHALKTQAGHRLLVGQKNAADNAATLASTLDFAVLEECRGIPNTSDSPFCSYFQTYIDKGKPVLQIEYPPSVSETGSLSLSDKTFYCTPETQDNNFSKILKWSSDNLDGWGEYCGGSAFRTPEVTSGATY